MASSHLMHVVLTIDHDRLRDDRPALVMIAQGLLEAGIEQTHVLGLPPSGVAVTPLHEDVQTLATPMPPRWGYRSEAVRDLAPIISRRPVDVLCWSGDAAATTARDLATRLEVPLACDTWRADQVVAARRRPYVDTWIARSSAIAEALRSSLRHGTVITARPPIDLPATLRTPDTRPTIVVLDPGAGRRRDASAVMEALKEVLAQRPDAEAFLELRGGASHRLWRIASKLDLLERVTVLDQVGTLGPLVAAATVVVAPDQAGPARTLIPMAMCGGAAVVAASTACEDLLVADETATIPDRLDAEGWTSAIGGLLSDPPHRQRLARAGKLLAQAECRPDTAIAAWATAIAASAEEVSYPVGTQ
jgi:glycosyltransferase involved in cell wall biosynthesis